MARDTTTGKTLERTIEHVLGEKGFKILTYSDFRRRGAEVTSARLLLKRVPYTTIYGSEGHTEYLLRDKEAGIEVRIECKWQQTSGSVDEKLPYLYLSCIESMPEETIIIVYGGGGWRPGAIPWLKKAVREKKYQSPGSTKEIMVMSIDDLITWANTVL